MDFTHYSAQTNAKADLSKTTDNRYRLWKKAFRPLQSRINSASRILDFGCGRGEFLNFVGKQTQAELVGFEISEGQRLLAEQLNRENPRVSIFDSLDKVQGTFDLVFCHHVIEHIPDPEIPSFMSKLCSRVSPQGRLIIVTPNGLNPIAHTFYMASDWTHKRMHSPFTLAEILQPDGYEIESVFQESPQVYDFSTFIKTLVWRLYALFFKLAAYSHAPGVRGLRHGLTMASAFYIVAKKVGSTTEVSR